MIWISIWWWLSIVCNSKHKSRHKKKTRWKTLKSTHTQPRKRLFASWFELCHPNSAWPGRHTNSWARSHGICQACKQPQFLKMGANQCGSFFSTLPTSLDKSCPSQFLGQRICTQQLDWQNHRGIHKCKIPRFKLWSFKRIHKSHLKIHTCNCKQGKPCRQLQGPAHQKDPVDLPELTVGNRWHNCQMRMPRFAKRGKNCQDRRETEGTSKIPTNKQLVWGCPFLPKASVSNCTP